MAMKNSKQRSQEVAQMRQMCATAELPLTARLEAGMQLYIDGRIGLGWLADLFELESSGIGDPKWTALFAYARDMPLKPHCPQSEWIQRAGRRLMELLPEMTAGDASKVVIDHLWEEACDLSPEEAAEVYLKDHPE